MLPLLSLLMSGCLATETGTTRKPKVAAVFPTKESVDSLESKPLPDSMFSRDVAAVETWDAESIHIKDDSPEVAPLLKALKDALGENKNITITREMSCFARDVAKFMSTTQASPNRGIEKFLAGRCGVVHPTALSFGGVDPAPAEKDYPEYLKNLGETLKKSFAKAKFEKGTELGIGLFRDKKNISVIISRAAKTAELEPGSLNVKNGTVVLKGRLKIQGSEAYAVINQGPYGVAYCLADPSVELPDFSFVCPVDESDSYSWVNILTRPPEALLNRSVVLAMVTTK